jgi:hypothetical protein
MNPEFGFYEEDPEEISFDGEHTYVIVNRYGTIFTIRGSYTDVYNLVDLLNQHGLRRWI